MEEQNSTNTGTAVRKKIVPEALAAMILGIVSIVTLYLGGWIAAIIGFSKRNKALKLYEENPSLYNDKSLNILRTAKTLNTIGLIVSLITTLLFILWIVFVVAMVSSYSY
jgi:hypothetical protein